MADLVPFYELKVRPDWPGGFLERESREGGGTGFLGAVDLTTRVPLGRWLALRGFAGGGIKGYKQTSDEACITIDGNCVIAQAFGADGVDELFHWGVGAAISRGAFALELEAGDFLSRYRGRARQHDLSAILNLRLSAWQSAGAGCRAAHQFTPRSIPDDSSARLDRRRAMRWTRTTRS